MNRACATLSVARVERARQRSRPVAWISRHPIVAVFVAALLVRIVVAIVLAVGGWIPRVAPDSRLYVRLAEHMAGFGDGRDAASLGDTGHFGTYLVPVSVLFRVFGPHVFLAQLVTAVFAAATAAVTTRLATEILPRWWAIAIGAVVAFYPSLVVWSSVPLRDSAVWAATACLALMILFVARARSVAQLAMPVATIGALLYLLGYLRLAALCIAGIALVIQALAGPARYRVATVVIAFGFALFVPWLVGIGPGGIDFIRQDLGTVRAQNAENAESAIDEAESARTSDLAYLPRGLTVILAEPLPWTSLHGETVTLARFEVPLWWVLVLSSFSALPLLWRTRRVLGFPALYATGLLFVLAIAEGNFGTSYRHRGELVWPMALLAGTGLHALWARRRSDTAPSRARAPT